MQAHLMSFENDPGVKSDLEKLLREIGEADKAREDAGIVIIQKDTQANELNSYYISFTETKKYISGEKFEYFKLVSETARFMYSPNASAHGGMQNLIDNQGWLKLASYHDISGLTMDRPQKVRIFGIIHDEDGKEFIQKNYSNGLMKNSFPPYDLNLPVGDGYVPLRIILPNKA